MHAQMQEKVDANNDMMWSQDPSGRYVQVPRGSLVMKHHQKTPATAAEYDENDPEFAYITIQQDPRYQRFLEVLAPDWNGKGVLQRAKNYIDPSHIPVFGTLVHIYRAGKRERSKETLDNLVENTQENSGITKRSDAALDPEHPDPTTQDMLIALKNMRLGAHIDQIKESTAAAISMFFILFPINSVVPVEDAAAKVVGFTVKKGVQKTLKTVTKKQEKSNIEHEKGEFYDNDDSVDSASDSDEELSPGEKRHLEAEEANVAKQHSEDVIDSWGEVKAFLLYLGLPRDDDEIYSLWEPSRLKIKALFGGEPERDMWHEKDNKLTKEVIQDIRDKKVDVNTLQIPLIDVLWTVFECRHLPYYNKVLQKPHRESKRSDDEKYYRRIINNADPNAILLHKCYLDSAANLLVQPNNTFGHGGPLWRHAVDEGGDHEDHEKKKAYLEEFALKFTKRFMKKQEVWGYVDPEDDNRLLAVMLWEPAENRRPSIDRMLFSSRAKGSMKLGMSNYSSFQKALKEPIKLRKKLEVPKNVGVIHLFNMNQSLSEEKKREIAAVFLSAILDIYSDESYAVLSRNNQAIEYLKHYGFTELPNSESDELIAMKCQGKWKAPAK